MNELIIKNFYVDTECEFGIVGKVRCICENVSYTFKTGVYALTGEINMGGWALSYTLTPNKKSYIYLNPHTNTEYFFNGNNLPLEKIQELSIYVGEVPKKKILNYNRNNTIKSIVEKSLKKNNSKYTVDEIQQMFKITNERFNRSILQSGYEVFRMSAAVGLANNKKIFCFPWLDYHFYQDYYELFKNICLTLKEQDCIVLVPATTAQILNGIYDYEVNLYQLFYEKVLREHEQNQMKENQSEQ